MKLTLSLLVLGLGVALCVPVQEKQYKTVDHAFLEKQYKVLTLFKHIHQPSVFEEHVEISKTVNDPIQWLQVNKEAFEKPEVVNTMIEFFHNGYMLFKGTPFSVMYHQHLEQAIALFKLFYYAKDFETFYKTAVVMHKFVNEGMFLYSTSVAVTHRKDCYGVILPPIYEVFPWYFYNTEVIQEAYKHKMSHGVAHKNDDQSHHVYVNYTGDYLNLHWEQSLSYFMEDVGLNSFYYYCHITYPFWMNGEEFHIKNDYRGEIFLVMVQVLAARYYMERLSHGEGQIPHFDWQVPFETPFYPSMQYPSGIPFPERPKFAQLQDYYTNYGQQIKSQYSYSYTHVLSLHRRFMDTIDAGHIWDEKEGKIVEMYHHEHHNEDVNKFGNLLQCNADSTNLKLFKNCTQTVSHILGYSHSPRTWQHVAPSAMEHFETTLRDPAAYQVLKKIYMYYNQYQVNNMQPYHKDELVFPGVTIQKIEMDRLITYFDEFHSDISNAVWDTTEELHDDSFKVWAIQKRINHKPFTYKIHVQSSQDTQAMVKVFLGPKYDEFGKYINISENRANFVPIDAFEWHLKSGDNIIKRSSQESQYYCHDRTTYGDLYKKVMGAYKGQGEFHVTGKENAFYFPDRLMLPMGSYNGMAYQFYFIVYPFKAYTGPKADLTYFYTHPGTGGGFVDDLPIYYPLDKPIKYGKMFVTEVPNSYFYETKIYHRTVDEVQVPQTQHQH